MLPTSSIPVPTVELQARDCVTLALHFAKIKTIARATMSLPWWSMLEQKPSSSIAQLQFEGWR
jgi:hypothetical protein